MLVVAHAGHWLVQLVYLVPLLVLVGVILAGRRRDRREAAAAQAAAPDRVSRPPATSGDASERKLREDPPQ